MLIAQNDTQVVDETIDGGERHGQLPEIARLRRLHCPVSRLPTAIALLGYPLSASCAKLPALSSHAVSFCSGVLTS
jgi:hypothetical protein